jgi:hypothetical protein
MKVTISSIFAFTSALLFLHLTIISANKLNDNVNDQSINSRIRRRDTGFTFDSYGTKDDDKRRLQLPSNDTKVEFFLYNADSDVLMTKMNEGFVVKLRSWGITNPAHITIEARISGTVKAYSAKFLLDNGLINSTDGGDFKLLCGNTGPDVTICPKMTYGKHKLSVTPYTGGAGTGNAMGTFTINFELIDDYTKPRPPVSSPIVPVTMPTIKYTLYNTKTNSKIIDLVNGMVVNLSLFNIIDPTQLNIQTTFEGDNKPSSVMYELNGNQHVSVDGGSIMSLCGNSGPIFYPCPMFTIGKQNLVLTLFTDALAMGNIIGHAHLHFILSKGSTPVAVPTPTIKPAPTPIKVPVTLPIAPSSGSDIQLFLMDAFNDVKIMNMYDGMVINVAKLNLRSTSLTIEAVYTKSKAETMKFSINDGQYLKIDGGERHFMCGNTGTDFFHCNFLSEGKYKLETTAFANGQTLGSYSISFEVINESLQAPTKAPTMTSFMKLYLMDADKDVKLMDMTDKMVINLATLNITKASSLTIEAVYTKTKAGTMMFKLNDGHISG